VVFADEPWPATFAVTVTAGPSQPTRGAYPISAGTVMWGAFFSEIAKRRRRAAIIRLIMLLLMACDHG